MRPLTAMPCKQNSCQETIVWPGLPEWAASHSDTSGHPISLSANLSVNVVLLFNDSVQTKKFPAQANELFSVCMCDNSWITHIVQLWWEPGRYLDNYGCIWMMFVWTTPTLYVSNFCTNTWEPTNQYQQTRSPWITFVGKPPSKTLCPFKKSKLPIV